MSAIVCDEPNGWTPVRDGDLYCSPRCGFRCTWQAYQDAVAGANALCALLGPTGDWKPRVWENGGWYYEARRGEARVSYYPKKGYGSRPPEFSCFLTTTIHGAGGHSLAYKAVHSADPRAAVQAALVLWRSDIDCAEREYTAILSGLDGRPSPVRLLPPAPTDPTPEPHGGMPFGGRSV